MTKYKIEGKFSRIQNVGSKDLCPFCGQLITIGQRYRTVSTRVKNSKGHFSSAYEIAHDKCVQKIEINITVIDKPISSKKQQEHSEYFKKIRLQIDKESSP